MLLAAAAEPLPPEVARAARRSLLNVLGTAVSAAGTDTVRVLLAAASAAGADGDVPLPGLARTLDPYWAALAIGTAAHLDDFDDTHLATVIHPGASTLAAVLSLVPETEPSGQRFLGAFAAGCEAQLRIGCAVSPAHYDHGWHITGTCGVFGTAVAAAVLLGLDAATTASALSLAATMTVGHREAFGTMTKPLHAGKAAANGVLAARLAAAGRTGPADILGPGGVLEVLANAVHRDRLGLGWPDGHSWELELNTIKTYPCGVVAHPAMDAAIDVFPRLAGAGGAAAITGITLRCNPLVPELMGLAQPEDGLRARFSARHGVAVGLRYGRAGLAEFSDAVATDPDVFRLRGLIALDPSPDVPRDAAGLRIEFRDSAAITVSTEHTRGSAARPLTDDEVLAKTRALFGPVLGAYAADRAWDAIGRLASARDVAELLAALRPSPQSTPTPSTSTRTAESSAAAAAAESELTATATDEVFVMATGGAAAVPDVLAAEAAFGALYSAVDRSGDSVVVRALRKVSPSSANPVDSSWNAFRMASALAATIAGAGEIAGAAELAETVAGDGATDWSGPAWIAACAAAVSVATLVRPDGTIAVAGDTIGDGSAELAAGEWLAAAVVAGIQAAAMVEAHLSDWGGWDGGTVSAAIGAVVTAARLTGLAEPELRNAIGIAATQAAGLRAAAGTDAGVLQIGKAAFNGVEAARLAAAGLTAPADPLGGRRGLFALFGPPAAEH